MSILEHFYLFLSRLHALYPFLLVIEFIDQQPFVSTLHLLVFEQVSFLVLLFEEAYLSLLGVEFAEG
jgi:hypothetical protein